MSFYHHTDAEFEDWKRELTHTDRPAWSMYDHVIRTCVTDFARFHSGRSGYIAPRWELIKAVIWIESGGPRNSAWKDKPMQIGVRGDLGIVDVTTQPEMGLIIPPDIRVRLNASTIRADPAANIQAGLALLHRKMAFLGRRPKTHPPDSSAERLASIDRRLGNTTLVLNHRLARDKTDLTLSSHRRTHGRPQTSESYISAWLPFCPVTIYQRYNIGDNTYVRKLEHCMKLMGH